MNSYICFYNGKRFEVRAESSYKAQLKCAADHKIPDKQRYKITVVLAAKEETPVFPTLTQF